MKRIVSFLLVIAMMFGIASCATDNTPKNSRERSKGKETIKKDENKDDIDDLKDIDGIMFTGSVSNCWMTVYNEDMWLNTQYVLYYDGTLEITVNRNLTGGITQSTQVLDSDYDSIYEFAYDGYVNETYKDYYEEVCDGETWAFCFYDSDHNSHLVYDGYAYSNDNMSAIEEILQSYMNGLDFSYPLPDEGVMLDVVVSYWEPIDWSTDNICGRKYVVNYDRTLDYYDLYTISDPVLVKSVELDDYNFRQIFEFCFWSKKDNPFKDYSEDNVDDGETWALTYYEDESEPFSIYDGYIYSNWDLTSFSEILEHIVE